MADNYTPEERRKYMDYYRKRYPEKVKKYQDKTCINRVKELLKNGKITIEDLKP